MLGLIPIVEPQIDIKSHDKKECGSHFDASPFGAARQAGRQPDFMLKLSLPSTVNFYMNWFGIPRSFVWGAFRVVTAARQRMCSSPSRREWWPIFRVLSMKGFPTSKPRTSLTPNSDKLFKSLTIFTRRRFPDKNVAWIHSLLRCPLNRILVRTMHTASSSGCTPCTT